MSNFDPFVPRDHDNPLHLSLIAVPDAMMWPVSGLYEVLNSFHQLGAFSDDIPSTPPFQVEIVAPSRSLTRAASGLSLNPDRTLDEVESTDILVLPSMFVENNQWVPGRYPEVVDWMSTMHRQGTRLCSACSGALLLAETGLLTGREATIHWAFAPTFRRNFPDVRLRLEQVLVISGQRGELVMSGASAGWHDLLLYLVASHVGPTVAQVIAKMMLLQWHPEGQAPYVTFREPVEHGDKVVLKLQTWLRKHYRAANPVEEMNAMSGLSERSFKRRFKRATEYSPLTYVQHLRIEEAKRRLERTEDSVEGIGHEVGYENPAFFRRLFKRITGVTPSAYRRKFQLPVYEHASDG